MRLEAALVALVVFSLVPASPASAQVSGSASVDLSLPTLAAPVSPAEPDNRSVTVRYQWEDGFTNGENVTIALSYEGGPPWLNSSFSPSTVEIDLGNRASGVETRIVNLTLDIADHAPAYTEAQGTYRAQAEQTGTLPSAETEENLALESGFAGRLIAELPGGNVTAWGGILQEVPIHLENTANGPIEVDVRVDRKPADARFTSPGTVTIGSEPGNRSLEATLELRTPWSLSIEGPVELALEPHHASEGTELSERRLSFHLEGHSAVPVPGPGPWLTLAVLGVALALRRR